MSERGHEGDEPSKKKIKRDRGGGRRRGGRYGGDDLDSVLAEVDDQVRQAGGLPKPAAIEPIKVGDTSTLAGLLPVEADEANKVTTEPVTNAVNTGVSLVESNKAAVVQSVPMTPELQPVTAQTEAQAQAEQLSDRERARRKYYDEQLFNDLMAAVVRVDKNAPQANEAYRKRDEARGRLRSAGLDMEEIVKRKQFRNEPENDYREYSRRVRDNVELIDTVTDFLSHPERILRKQQQKDYYIDFLVGLGVNAESIQAVIDENVQAYLEQQAKATVLEQTPITTVEEPNAPEKKKRDLNEVEKAIERQPVDYWIEHVVQFGIDEKEDAKIIKDFAEKGPNSPEWKNVMDLLNLMAAKALNDHDKAKYDALKKIIDGLESKPKILTKVDEDDDIVRDKTNEDSREKWMKEMKMYAKMGIVRARKEIFEYWSTDEYDGVNAVAAVYNDEIGTVKELRMRVLDMLGQSRELNRGAQTLARVVDRIVNSKIRRLETTDPNKLKLIKSYREWAMSKAAKYARQVQGQWKDEDPRVWDEDTPEEVVIARIRQDLLAKEKASSRSGGRWAEIIDYRDQGVDYRVLDCIQDEVLKDELTKEIEARDHLDEFFRGYDGARKNAKDLIAFFDRVKNEKLEVKSLIMPLAKGRLGLGEAISAGIKRYIDLGEEGFNEYYTNIIKIPGLKGPQKEFAGRNELRRRLFELKMSDPSSPDIDLIEKEIKKSEARDDNFFSLTKTSEQVEKVRARVEKTLLDSNTSDDVELNELNAQSGELIGLRLVYILGLAGKFNFEQDATNNQRDDLASLYRVDERWQINKRAATAQQTPITVSGPRVAKIGERPLARAVFMVSWIEMMSEITPANVVTGGDNAIKDKIDRLVTNAYSVRELRKKPPEGVQLKPGEVGDPIADYLATERLSPIYQMLHEGRFDEIQWNMVKSEFGKLAAFASFALDVKSALEQPGVKPENGTPDEKGMNWMRDKVAALAGLYKLSLSPQQQPSEEKRKKQSAKDQEDFINSVVFRWANAILESHNPSVRGVPQSQRWTGDKFDAFLTAVNDSGLLTNTNTDSGKRLMDLWIAEYGLGLRGVDKKMVMALRNSLSLNSK